MQESDILAQSKAAYSQWAEQWREHAKAHAIYEKKPLSDFENTGVGKACLLVANGYSFEENIETIKKYQHNVDIIACDKTLGSLLDHGITPKFCIVCDANVNYETYLKPWVDKVGEVILLTNACANPVWTEKGQWKDRYFFINKDILESEKEFAKLSGCNNFIPAGTNVSNAMLVMITQCSNEAKRNFFGYDKILCIGFDYSWRFDGKYYAFSDDGGGKANYRKHIHCTMVDGSFGYTSGNLAFSAKWFEKYVVAFQLPVIIGSNKTILSLKSGSLVEHMQYKYKTEDCSIVKDTVAKLREITKIKNELENKLTAIGKDHWMSFLTTA